jgi:F0F1-type ATP synthase delta subunit
MKSKIKDLVKASYKNGQLDPDTVSTIADHFNRHSLKEYIKLIKQEEGAKQVVVTSPKVLTDTDRTMIQNQFPDKKIIYILDPEMISGIKIVDKDVEYEISLKRTFNDIIDHINNYD